MQRALLDGRGHSPEASEKQGQRAILSAGGPYTDNLLMPAIQETGQYLDQGLSML
jgi:hypothetical protein